MKISYLKMFRAILVLLAVISITGCASMPTKEEIESADYGNYPSDYEKTISNYMFRVFKDPESARYQFLNEPKKGWITLGGKRFGYVVCSYINAKNSFGGYTGAKLHFFMIKNNLVVSHHWESDDFIAQATVEGLCGNFIS